MHPAPSALTLATLPTALTLKTLAAALDAEAVLQSAIAATAPTRLAANAARDLALEHKRRKSLAAASDAAERLAAETAEALGYEDKSNAAHAARGELIRALYADRVRALGYGPMWTGCGYSDVLADAVADPARDGGYLGGFKPLGDRTDTNVDALLTWDAWQGEVTSISLRAHLPATRRNGEPYMDTFDAIRVRFPEATGFGAAPLRRAVAVSLTGTSLEPAALAPYGAIVGMAQALVALAERYAVAHPERTPRADAADLIANGGLWRAEDRPEVFERRFDPRG